MYYSKQKINSANINLQTNEIAEYLIQLGHEVESYENYAIDGLKIGHVLSVEKHPEADKLQIVKVDIKTQTLQIVCGAPNIAVDQKVIVATIDTVLPAVGLTIKPVQLKGVESNGMICSISELGMPKSVLSNHDIDGIHVLDQDAPVGEDAAEYLGLNDIIFDVSLTADRGDCLNYKGIINDLGALYKYNQKIEWQASINDNLEVAAVDLIDNPYSIANEVEATSYFSHRLCRNVKITESSIQNRLFLMKHGIKPQNNIVDLSAIAMLEYGIPTHMYDADKIVGGLVVKQTSQPEKFVALDGNQYDLEIGTLVISDQEKIVAIAGVMGSDATKITDQTTNVLMEVAVFNPVQTRISAKNLGFKTDASIRFEKGVDLASTIQAYQFITEQLVANDCQLSVISEAIAHHIPTNTIEVKFASVKDILGISIEKDHVIEILTALNFKVLDKTNEKLELQIPSIRHDIKYENDIIEEIIRIYGINEIPVSELLLSMNKLSDSTPNLKVFVERFLEEKLLSSGLNQVVSYSLVNEDRLSHFLQSPKQPVKILSPLSKEREYFRQSIVSSLVDIAKYNLDRQQKEVKIFEIANIYEYRDQENINEDMKVAGLVTGEYQNYFKGAKRNYDFYDLKGVVQSLFEKGKSLQFKPLTQDIKQLNPYAAADIVIDGKIIGFIGELVPTYVKKSKYPIFVFELNLDDMLQELNFEIDYQQISNAPTIERDLTFVAPVEKTYEQFQTIFEDIEYLQQYKLVDVYSGDKVASGMHAITINLMFAADRTLTSEEVETQVQKIIENARTNGYQFNQ